MSGGSVTLKGFYAFEKSNENRVKVDSKDRY